MIVIVIMVVPAAGAVDMPFLGLEVGLEPGPASSLHCVRKGRPRVNPGVTIT